MENLFNLIRHIARLRLRATDVVYIDSFLKDDAPWDELCSLADTEGVEGLLYHHLHDLKLLDRLPRSVLESLENNYLNTSRNTLGLLSAVRALSTRLAESQIYVIALQGLSVLRLYGDPGLRPLGDVDLLVKGKDKDRLKALLKQAGYRVMSSRYTDLFCKDGITLDIHTHVLNLERIRSRRTLFPEDLSSMWERARPFFGPHSGVLLLDPYDNFVALAAHALKHGYSRLIWLADLHQWVLQRDELEACWKNLVRRAGFWNQERVVLYALLLLEGMFDLEIPREVKYELGFEELGKIEKRLLHLKSKGIFLNILCLILWLLNIQGSGNKLKFIKETLFPREEVMEQIFFQHPEKRKGFRYGERAGNAIRLLIEDLRRAR